jgi:AcrR family transcriptional regulator
MGTDVPLGNQETLTSGRVNQKRRTRDALLAAARDILDEGRIPSIADAADGALVGRTTAYRYFTSQDQLILEASLGEVVEDIDKATRADVTRSGDPGERVDRILQALHGRITAHEAAFRAIIRMSLEKEARLSAGQHEEVRLLGGRRMAWMRHALQPAADRLSSNEVDDLVAAVAMLAGAEAFISLKDGCQVSDAQERSRIIRWAVQMIVAGALDVPATASNDEPTDSPQA